MKHLTNYLEMKKMLYLSRMILQILSYLQSILVAHELKHILNTGDNPQINYDFNFHAVNKINLSYYSKKNKSSTRIICMNLQYMDINIMKVVGKTSLEECKE